MPSPYVTQLNPDQIGKLRQVLQEQDYEFSQPAYTIFQARKKGLTCTAYSSGKVVIQGKEEQMKEFIQFSLEPQILESFQYGYEELSLNLDARIGIDESGKGDFFGPLCIAGVYAEGEGIKRLQSIGVKDSKKLSDSQIEKIAQSIQKEFVHEIIRIFPGKYNQLYSSFGNLNTLLGWGHATAIENLYQRTSCPNAIIDQFASEHVVLNALSKKKISIELHQRHRGEEDLVVAAASILARFGFISGLKKLSEQYGIDLPKGASQTTIAAGKRFVERYGQEDLPQVAKMHFKTLDAILNKTSE